MLNLDCLEKIEGSKDDHDLTLFALSTCGWCGKARSFLDDNDLAYGYVYLDKLEGKDQKDVLSRAAEFNPKKTFPTLIIDDKDVLVGFNDDAYREKLL